MISIRKLTRSAPRSISRLAGSAARKPTTRQAAVFASAWKPEQCQAFSTSRMVAKAKANAKGSAKTGGISQELVAKLESELEQEVAARDAEDVPTSVKEYLANGPFEITDVTGEEEVVLTREFGSETIRVTFSIADLHAMDGSEAEADRAMDDEDNFDNQFNQQKGAQDESFDDPEGQDDSELPGGFPVRVNVIVTKAQGGALQVECIAQDGMILIEGMYYHADAALAEAKTAEKFHQREKFYLGPQFNNLEDDLQVLVERYLDERGINTTLALFVPDYIEWKEQKEYVRWLSSVQKFVEA